MSLNMDFSLGDTIALACSRPSRHWTCLLPLLVLHSYTYLLYVLYYIVLYCIHYTAAATAVVPSKK